MNISNESPSFNKYFFEPNYPDLVNPLFLHVVSPGVHPDITIEMNDSYPIPDAAERCIREKIDKDRNKKEECRIPSCRYYLIKMARLERHIFRTHKMKFSKYKIIFCDQHVPENDRFLYFIF